VSRPAELQLGSDEAFAALVRDFERGVAPPGGFTHQAHLAVALAYLDRYGMESATERLREALLGFLRRALGDDTAAAVKYRETITVFWLRLLAAALARTDPELPLHARAAPLLARYRDAGIIHAYYSDDRLYSEEARKRFLEPDRKALPPLA